MKKRIFSIFLTTCMLVAVIAVISVGASAADAAVIAENGAVYRTADTNAEVGFCATSCDFTVDWQYYYLVTADSAKKTADEVISGGTASDFDENFGVGTIVLTNLTAGVKYIHIVLVQKADTTQISNVLKLQIPEFVKLTLKPSAQGGDYNKTTNTLTVSGGGEVSFTLNIPGYVHCDSDQTIEPTSKGDDPENATEWWVNLPNEDKTYTFYCEIVGQTSECIVTVKHAHSFEYECSAKCSVCDYERLATHVYESFIINNKYHDRMCKYCGVTYDSGVFLHEYDNDCDPVCDFCGYERAVNHNYEWLIDAEGHEEKCRQCGDVRIAGAAHISSGAATDDTPETCTICGYEIAPKLESTLTIIYYDKAIGGVLAYAPGNARYKFPTGTVVDLSDHWPDTREYTVDGEKYTFWNFTPNAGHGNILTSVTLNQDTTVYACWVTTDNMHAITFDATGGSVVPKKIVDRNLWLVNDNVPTRLGYEFLGWSLENDGTPDDFWGYDLTSDCTLYATWKQIHNISPNWSYDEEVHYRTCDCGERHDETEHSCYITSSVCYKCGYVKGMAIGLTDKTSVEFVPATGSTLPEGSYIDVKAYEVVEKDVDAIFRATVANGVSDVTEITPTSTKIIGDDGWVFSDRYTLRMGDKVTIGGVTYIVTSYEDDVAVLVYNCEVYWLVKGKGLRKQGDAWKTHSDKTEIISIDGVRYVVTARLTSENVETVYFATMDGKSAGVCSIAGHSTVARFYHDCTPEALITKVSVGGVVAIADGQFLVNTSDGVKIVNTVWANDVSLHGANGLPISGINGRFTVSGIQYAATKSTVAAHIGAQGVDVGRFDDSVFDIRDVDDFSPFVLLDVVDFSGMVIELTGITLLDAEPNGLSTGAIAAIVIASVAVLACGGYALYWFVFRKRIA